MALQMSASLSAQVRRPPELATGPAAEEHCLSTAPRCAAATPPPLRAAGVPSAACALHAALLAGVQRAGRAAFCIVTLGMWLTRRSSAQACAPFRGLRAASSAAACGVRLDAAPRRARLACSAAPSTVCAAVRVCFPARRPPRRLGSWRSWLTLLSPAARAGCGAEDPHQAALV
jgi:hypothetical protein